MKFVRGKNCIALGLSGCASCDPCNKFRDRKAGLSGRKPGKKESPKCQELWMQDDATHYGRRLIQDRARAELKKMGYAVGVGKSKERKVSSKRSFLTSARAYKRICCCPEGTGQQQIAYTVSHESKGDDSNSICKTPP